MDWVLWLLLLVALGWAAKKFLDGRRPAPPEDEWVLPPEPGGPASVPRAGTPTPWATASDPAPFPVLDRDALVNRDRTLDVTKWDNSPDDLVGRDLDEPTDAAPEEPGDDLPRYFDRSWLEGRGKDGA